MLCVGLEIKKIFKKLPKNQNIIKYCTNISYLQNAMKLKKHNNNKKIFR